MIKLFRNIRQNLINHEPSAALAKGGGKTSKYLKYAIGEIVYCPVRDNILVAKKQKNKQRAVRYAI